MPNPIKYSGTTELNALKSGDWWIGTNDIALGPTSESDFYVGIEPPSNGYTIYEARPDNLPSIYVAQGDEELIFLTNHISDNSYTTIQQCFNYFNDQNNKFVLRRNIEPIVTDGLVFYLDAGLLPSYPRSGTTWNDLSLSGNNGTLINGVSYNNGAMVFDGVDDYGVITTIPKIISGSFSFEICLKITESPVISDDGIFNPDDYTAVNKEGFYVWVNNAMRFHYIINTENGVELNERNLNLQLDKYYHFILTYEKNITEGSKLYVDGSLTRVNDTTGFGNINNDSTYLIGRRGTDLNSYFLGGNILFMRYYNKRLTLEEVLQNYNAQKDRYAFITTWETTSSGETITLPLISTGTYDFNVEWGDGNTDTITSYNQSEVTHTYTDAGTYTVKIRGIIQGFQFNNGGDKHKIKSIDNYGPLVITTGGAFYGCTGLTSSAIDSPVITTTDLASTFRGCTNFNGYINNWNVSSVTNMNGMFYGALSFNQPLNNWDVSNVTDMSVMFYGVLGEQTSFNQPLNDWDVSSVTNMSNMFGLNTSFNQPLNNWDVSSVTDMSNMFGGSSSTRSIFNQDIGSWNVSGVTDMNRMFGWSSAFNNGGSPSINNWNVSNVTDMEGMFYAAPFNQPIGNWDVSNVTYMQGMLAVGSFNQDISNWDVSSVTNMNYMFQFNYSFNQDISNWDVSSVTNMSYMFYFATSFNNGESPSINNWNVSGVTSMLALFSSAKSFNQPIGNWDVSNVTTMQSMFSNNNIFNQDISNWNVSNVTNMQSLFYRCYAFNQDISGWDVSSATNMYRMFLDARIFNQPIGNWNVSGVTTMSQMFYNADAFDQDISNWDIDQVTNFSDFMIFANGLSTTNYDALLVDWEAQVPQPNLTINFGGSKYTSGSAAATARQSLIDNYNWTIIDGGTA